MKNAAIIIATAGLITVLYAVTQAPVNRNAPRVKVANVNPCDYLGWDAITSDAILHIHNDANVIKAFDFGVIRTQCQPHKFIDYNENDIPKDFIINTIDTNETLPLPGC